MEIRVLFSLKGEESKDVENVFFLSVSCDKNWEFGSKAIDFLEKWATFLIGVS